MPFGDPTFEDRVRIGQAMGSQTVDNPRPRPANNHLGTVTRPDSFSPFRNCHQVTSAATHDAPAYQYIVPSVPPVAAPTRPQVIMSVELRITVRKVRPAAPRAVRPMAAPVAAQELAVARVAGSTSG